MDWTILGSAGEFFGAIGSILIACVAVFIATRQYLDEKRFAREQKALMEDIERKNEIARIEQDRLVRAQSLDSYFDGISNLILRDDILNSKARNLSKGRTDAILKVLAPDEKRNLLAFLYGSGLITPNEESDEVVIGLSGSDLSHAQLDGFTLRNAHLGMAILKDAQITDCDLNQIDMPGADLERANLKGSEITEANLHGILGFNTNLSASDLSGTDIGGADLREANLSESDLTGGNLSGANLRGANLVDANLTGANLSGANLRDVNLADANLLDADLSSLISIDGADFSGVLNLSDTSREYLSAIASGENPITGAETGLSLN